MGKYGGKNFEAGDNTKSVLFGIEIMKLPRFDLRGDGAADLLREHCRAFLELCMEFDRMPGQSNFAQSLHISRKQLQVYLAGRGKPLDSDVFEILWDMNQLFESIVENNLMSGTGNVVGNIFVGKNNFGFKDQAEQVIVHTAPMVTAEELRLLADNLPDVIEGEYETLPGTEGDS